MKHSLKDWILLTRPWSLPASTMPAIIAVAFAFYQYKLSLIPDLHWIYGIVAFFGAAFFQMSGNLISDYYDFINNVDRKDSYGMNRSLIDGSFQPKTILIFGIVLMIVGCTIGLILFFLSSYFYLLPIGVLGVLCTYFYYKFKYIALGDALIFVVYGILIGLGTFYVTTGFVNYQVLLVSFPLGLLIVAILHANNTRDILQDKKANINTFAMTIGVKNSILYYSALLIFNYLLVIAIIVLKIFPLISLITLLSMPIAFKNIKLVKKYTGTNPEIIIRLDAFTSQLVLVNAFLMTISLLIQ